MWLIRPWSLMLAFVCIAPLTLAESPMSAQQQCAEYGVQQDASGNWIECVGSTSQQNGNDVYRDEPYAEDTYVDEPYVEEPYVEETYIEDTYTEEPYVEQPYVEESYAD